MKPKFYALLLGAVCFFVANNAHAFTASIIFVKPATTTNIDPDPLASISAKQFLTLTPKKYHELTGKKMNIVQKIELKKQWQLLQNCLKLIDYHRNMQCAH